MRTSFRLIVLAMALVSGPASAAVRTMTVEYTSPDNTVMEGFVAYDDAAKSPRPGVLIVHDWMGLGDFSKEKALKLAKEGYVAFAADVYGKGVRPANASEAGELAGKYKGDRAMLRAHVRAAYDSLAGFKITNPKKIAVMGYCFGGTTALELARSGAPLAGTVSFHGGLSTPNPADAKNITGPVLALHGADDPMVPPAEVDGFKKEMADAQVKLTFVPYAGAVHSFTNPKADSLEIKGVAYNAKADKASWTELQKFLKQNLK